MMQQHQHQDQPARPAAPRPAWRLWRQVIRSDGRLMGVLLLASPLSPLMLAARPPLSLASPPAAMMAHFDTISSHDVPQGATPAQLASITTDTGAFTPGHRDFARYTTPLECVAAVAGESRAARSTVAVLTTLDTLQDASADTIGLDRVRRVARACGARFTLANTPPTDVPILLSLAVAAQNETAAQAIFTRLTGALPPAARVHAAAQLVDDLLGGDTTSAGGFIPAGQVPLREHELYTPDRPLVTFLLDLIDQQGSPLDHVQLADRLRQYWILRGDTAAVRRQSERVLALARQLPPGTLVNPGSVQNQAQPVWRIYHDRLRDALYHTPDSVRALDSLHAIARRAQQDLGAWQTYRWSTRGIPEERAVIDFRTLSVEATLDTLLPERARWRATARKRLPALQADVWFGPTHATLVHPVQPVPGQVTFIMVSDVSTGMGPQQAPLVRRMLAEYGTRGLAVTVMTRTEGWIDYGDYLPALEPLTPAAEAEELRSYYQDYEGLPVTVGVQRHHVTKRPPPDGRLVQTDTVHPFPPYCDKDEQAWDAGFFCALLVGRDGTVLWQGNMLATDAEADGALLGRKSEFPDILARAISEPSVTPSTTRPVSAAPASPVPSPQP